MRYVLVILIPILVERVELLHRVEVSVDVVAQRTREYLLVAEVSSRVTARVELRVHVGVLHYSFHGLLVLVGQLVPVQHLLVAVVVIVT